MSKIEVIRGDDITINATFKDDNGDAINITGYTVFFTVKDNYTSTTDSAALISKTVTSHTSPTTGATTFSSNIYVSGGTVTNTCSGCSACDFTYDSNKKISGCKCTDAGSYTACCHTKTQTDPT